MVNRIKRPPLDKNILWIEDDAEDLGGMVRPLIKKGYRITIAHSEREALDALERDTFDLILFDIIIPSGSPKEEDFMEFVGLHLAEEIIKNRGIKTPIIGISVVNRPDVLEKLYRLGFKSILAKGYVLPSELADEVEKVLGMLR
jgi:CheY-like chemotaxis protein